MEAINHECYVSFEVAKLLKETGFDWPVMHFYDEFEDCKRPFYSRGSEELQQNMNAFGYYSAPTLEVAQRWLREVKHIEAVPWRWPTKVGFADGYKPWSYKIVIYKNLEEVDIDDFNASGEDYFKSYEEAQEAGIKEALEMILEKGK